MCELQTRTFLEVHELLQYYTMYLRSPRDEVHWRGLTSDVHKQR